MLDSSSCPPPDVRPPNDLDSLHQVRGATLSRSSLRTILDPVPADIPIHFFTLVLNGEPFIRHHLPVLLQLPFRWHWHVVEGAATLSHDTGWSLATGGELPESMHREGLSLDGTSGYLDEIAARHPEQISLYRPEPGQCWDGKIAMVSAPLRHLQEEAVLWQMDADELWTVEQLAEAHRMFQEHPEKAAAWFWCHYFVGEDRVISSRHSYAQHPDQEWLRAWRFRPGMKWLTHEPPVLAEQFPDGSWQDVARGQVFSHAETEARGLVFQHYAYATKAQVAFKEHYYGYANALVHWQRLQQAESLPQSLRDYCPWVADHTEVTSAAACGIVPLATRCPGTGDWTFASRAPLHEPARSVASAPVIVVDGVFFQLNDTGIARVWSEVLHHWGKSAVGGQVWLLDRDGTAPEIPGIRRRQVARYHPEAPGPDARMLQAVCDGLGAGVFISTYCTAPTATPSVMMVHDMIPELLNVPLLAELWLEKRLCLAQARHWVCVSHSTARDLRRLHPWIPQGAVTVASPAAGAVFQPAEAEAVAAFRQQHGLEGDYVMVVGERVGITVSTLPFGYKNAALAFKAWVHLPTARRETLTILCTGGQRELEPELQRLAPEARVKLVRLNDADMATAYSGALALVYPSHYEGFGLPVIEAMACGCPVIACPRASLAEVARDAGIWIEPHNAAGLAASIVRLQDDPDWRAGHIAAGRAQAAKFSFASMAHTLMEVLQAAAAESPQTVREHPGHAVTWQALRTLQTRLHQREHELGQHLGANATLQDKVTRLKASLQIKKEEAKMAQKALKRANQRLARLESDVEKRFRRWWQRW